MYRYIITPLLFCCISFNAYAQVISLKKDHPEQYVVIKGDTLWGISAKFLNDPWLWPKVWQLNRAQIKNPDLIYPGDVVMRDNNGSSPQLRLLRETVSLQPGAVEEPLDKVAITTIPLNVIAPFLRQPLIIEKDQLADSPRIIAGQDDRVVLSPGTRVYINNIEDGDAINWFVYRPGGNLIDPDSKELLGVEALYLGDAKVSKYGQPASADITNAKEEIFTKDRLIPADDKVFTNFVPHAPDKLMTGRIINIYGGLAEAGPESVVAISRGAADGIEVGHVLAINRFGRVIKDPEPTKEKLNAKLKSTLRNNALKDDAEGKAVDMSAKATQQSKAASALEPGMVKLPDERVGLLMVFRVFERVSYGLIMQATRPIYKLDSIQTP
jgi:hypothetical protein